MHVPVINANSVSFSDYEIICGCDDAIAVSTDKAMTFLYIGDWDANKHKTLTIQANEILKAFWDKGYNWVRLDIETGTEIESVHRFEWEHLWSNLRND